MKDECRKSLEKVYLYLDGEVLSEVERRDIQVHLESCPPCDERFEVERDIKLLMIRAQGTDRCPERLRHQIARLLESDPAPGNSL